MRGSLLERLVGAAAGGLSRIAVWYRWPFPINALILPGLRDNMRRGNLFDTERRRPDVPEPEVDPRVGRSADGSFNDLSEPWMGMAGARFGRNFAIERTFGEAPPRLYEPNPREVSNKLLARREFVPVPHLNVLVSAWIQFMVHDWVSHGVNLRENPHSLPVAEEDDWPDEAMTILRSRPAPDNASDLGQPDAYVNIETHWWDGSQLYGSARARQLRIRSDPETGELLEDGTIGLAADGHLPIEKTRLEMQDAEGERFPGLELTGVNGNWWIGLSVMHTLFAREHNAIARHLKMAYPDATGEWLFQKARLVNAALMAKIHTVEWTPALMNSPEGRFAMRSNWWGVLGEQFKAVNGRVSALEEVSGIMGSAAEHHAAPYSMTEEFVAVYRMHSLVPDDVSFRRHADDSELLKTDLSKLVHGEVPKIYKKVPFDDVVYSLATSHPGALTLHNFPNQLRKLVENKKKGIFIDLAAIDVLRDRERGVPRYCEFRRLLDMPVPKSFEEITTDPQWREELREVYDTVEDVDLLVGTLVEGKSELGLPPGFGFSDTVFRIFILMASRRLKSDRFFTDDFTPEVYTPEGWKWIEQNGFRDVLERHCPDLAMHFADCRNVFFPWAKAGKE